MHEPGSLIFITCPTFLGKRSEPNLCVRKPPPSTIDHQNIICHTCETKNHDEQPLTSNSSFCSWTWHAFIMSHHFSFDIFGAPEKCPCCPGPLLSILGTRNTTSEMAVITTHGPRNVSVAHLTSIRKNKHAFFFTKPSLWTPTLNIIDVSMCNGNTVFYILPRLDCRPETSSFHQWNWGDQQQLQQTRYSSLKCIRGTKIQIRPPECTLDGRFSTGPKCTTMKQRSARTRQV